MRTRLFVLVLVVAAAAAFAAGWWYRGRENPSVEDRTREATEHMKEAIKSLTR